EDVFDSFINKNSIEENEQTLKDVNDKKQLFQFLNWIEIKSKGTDEAKHKNILLSILSYSKNLQYKSGMFWGIGSDLITVLHYVSDMLKNISDLEDRKNLIFEYIKSNRYFSSFYLCDRILYA